MRLTSEVFYFVDMVRIGACTTYADAIAQYRDNLDYDLVSSVTKAQLFIEACRFLQDPSVTPRRTRGMDNGAEVEVDTTIYKEAEERALAWLQDNGTTTETFGAVVHPDFNGFRV